MVHRTPIGIGGPGVTAAHVTETPTVRRRVVARSGLYRHWKASVEPSRTPVLRMHVRPTQGSGTSRPIKPAPEGSGPVSRKGAKESGETARR